MGFLVDINATYPHQRNDIYIQGVRKILAKGKNVASMALPYRGNVVTLLPVCYSINATMTKKPKEPVRLREKRLANGNRSLYLDIYHEGSREYEFLRLYLIPETDKSAREKNAQTLSLANAIRARRIVEMQNGRHGFATSGNVSVLQYFDHVSDEHGGGGVWDACRAMLSSYCGKMMMRDIDTRFCVGYKSFLAREGRFQGKANEKHIPLGKSSQNAYFAKFRTFIRHAYNEGVIAEDYCRNVGSVKHPPAKREYLTIDELKRVAAADCKKGVIKRAFLFSCFTGLRISDIRRLVWSDVVEQDGFVRIIFRQKKTQGMEYLDINEQAVAMMGDRGKDSDRVFGDVGNWYELKTNLEELCDNASVQKHITFHCARHTFATMMLTLGTDIYTTSKLLGHTDVKTTQVYAKIIDEKKRSAVSNIPKII